MTEIVSTFDIGKLEQFLLIMTRITSFIFISPVFGMSNVPARVKIVRYGIFFVIWCS